MQNTIKLLTEEARKTRFDFDWTVKDCPVPLIIIDTAEGALRQALSQALGTHGVLDR